MGPEDQPVPASGDESEWDSLELPDEESPSEETEEEREDRALLEQLRRRKPK